MSLKFKLAMRILFHIKSAFMSSYIQYLLIQHPSRYLGQRFHNGTAFLNAKDTMAALR